MHLLSSRLSETRYSRNDCSVYACQHHISMSGLTRNVKKHTNGTSRNERRGSKSGAREIVCQVANETPPTKNLRPRRALNIYDIPYDKHMYYRTLTFAVNVDSILVHVSKLYFLLLPMLRHRCHALRVDAKSRTLYEYQLLQYVYE